jgi:DNA polymerase
VLGEGPPGAAVALVGEQPGDEEDRAGRPFVGPAGAVLDEALARAGIARAGVYVTNAVKHFKFEPRGKRRIHQAPDAREVAACNPWLEAELALVRPRVVVALGNTAARALRAPRGPLAALRGRVHATPLAARLVATWHPAAPLRAADAGGAERMRRELAADLAFAARVAGERP